MGNCVTQHNYFFIYIALYLIKLKVALAPTNEFVPAKQERFFLKFVKNHAGLGFLEEDRVLVNLAEEAQQGTLLFAMLCIKISFVTLEAI